MASRTVSLTERQQVLAAKSIVEFQISKTEQGIHLRLRALRGFSSGMLKGVSATLFLNEELKDCASVEGTVHIRSKLTLTKNGSRGAWHSYDLRLTDEDRGKLQFSGFSQQWSNITCIVINLGKQGIFLQNAYTQPPRPPTESP